MRRLRILIGGDTYFPDVNGASVFTQRLAEGLRARGHDVHVACPSRGLRPTCARQGGVIIHGLPALPLPLYPTFRVVPPPCARGAAARLLRRLVPDIVHIQGHFPIGRALAGRAHAAGIPLVATNHFMPDNLVFHLRLPEDLAHAVSAWAWRDFARVFNQAGTITTPTPRAAALIRAQGIVGPVTAISCGVDLVRFSPDNDGDAFRRRYGIPARPTYLHVGRLEEEKHIGELIAALPLVRRRVDAQLVLVGAGLQRQALAALAARAGVGEHVIFTGLIPDEELPGAYAACDVFCTAGRAELQSLVTMEALATGKPVVVAQAMALPHLVDQGRNGYTFPPGDVAALAEALVSCQSSSTG
jgi:1,2-diacylglycerol 3-alpha-glucosyltransferase